MPLSRYDRGDLSLNKKKEKKSRFPFITERKSTVSYSTLFIRYGRNFLMHCVHFRLLFNFIFVSMCTVKVSIFR